MAVPLPPPRNGTRPFQGERPRTWRERLAAMRHLPRLLRLVWATEPRYVVGVLAFRVVGALVPLGVLWIGKLIVDEVVASIAAYSSGTEVEWRRIGWLLAAEFGIALVGAIASRGGALLESLLGDLFANRT